MVRIFDNKKLFKKLNASNVYTYLNKKKQSNNSLSNNIIKKFHNKTNSSINNTESTFSINKTSNNFNHILKIYYIIIHIIILLRLKK